MSDTAYNFNHVGNSARTCQIRRSLGRVSSFLTRCRLGLLLLLVALVVRLLANFVLSCILVPVVDVELELRKLCQARDRQAVLQGFPAEHYTA